MILKKSDHIAGILAYEVPGAGRSPEGSEYTHLTVSLVCLRREGQWLAQMEFHYSNDRIPWSPGDRRNQHTFTLPALRNSAEYWPVLRDVLSKAAARVVGTATAQHGELHELVVDGSPEKLQLILAGAPGKLAPLARMVRLGESLN
jgi:hypothetical protein